MLILSRKVRERIMIGNGIIVTVTSIRGSIVRLGVECPKDVSILRGELKDKKVEGNDDQV